VRPRGGDRERHGHGAGPGREADWEALADSLEVDGELVLPLVEAVVTGLEADGLDAARVAHVVDVGCGPGVVSCALARRLPAAVVTGVDAAPRLLDRLRRRAAASGLAGRIATVEADLDGELPPLAPADLVWCSMVAHHLSDPVASLRRLRGLLRPGGTLVLVELAASPEVLPPSDPLVSGGAWERLEGAAAAALVERLGFDAFGHDWAADLARAGFARVSDRVLPFRHDAPLGELGRRWLVRHVRRGLGMAGGALAAGDADALEALAAAVEGGERSDPFVAAERRVLTARRPG
jgi:SAM-dependent methyltransferase